MRQIAIGLVVVALLVSASAPAHAQGGRFIGVAVAAAGAAMTLIEPTQPTQPTQPGPISHDMLRDGAVDQFEGLTRGDVISLRRQTGQPVLICEPFCPGDVDEAILGSFVTGSASGIVATTIAIDEAGWQLYAGQFRPFIPFEERNPAMKYGGAAMVIGGAILAAAWPDSPATQNLSVTPTQGGVKASKSFGF